MNSGMKQHLQAAFAAFHGFQSAQQIAWGVTLGMFIGLIPKDSLFVVLACVLILATTASLFCGLLSALAFSLIGWIIDPLLHKLGAVVLTNDAFVRLWASIYQLPVVPWTRVNNTVVLGGVIASLVLAYPLFQITRVIAAGTAPKLHSLARHLVILHWPKGGSQQSPMRLR